MKSLISSYAMAATGFILHLSQVCIASILGDLCPVSFIA